MTSSRNEAYAAKLASRSVPDDHITRQLSLTVGCDDRGAFGGMSLRPAMWGEESRRPRLAIIAMLVDIVAGQLPEPHSFPTVDLRVQLLSEPPSAGAIEVVGQTLRAGRRFVVSEFQVHDAGGRSFGRGTATMLNNRFEGGKLPGPPTDSIPSFDRLLGTRVVDERSLEFDLSPRLLNGAIDTPHGGAQMLLAELAAEHAADDRRAGVDIDIRFLRPAEVGPLRAVATRAGRVGSLDVFRVDLLDVGAEGALAAAATILSRPLDDAERE